jgi:hypothetical protein
VAEPVTIQQVQAAAEGVVLDDRPTVELLGQRFGIADHIGVMPLMRFAAIAASGVEHDDLEGLAAMYALIRDCIDQTRPQKPVLDEHGEQLIRDGQPVTEDDGESEWDRFERHAIDAKAEADDLWPIVGEVIRTVSARPTRRPGVSSAGPRPTSVSSKATSSSPPAGRVPPGYEQMVPVASLAVVRDGDRLTA